MKVLPHIAPDPERAACSWVACDRHDSPAGPLFVAATDAGLCAVTFEAFAEEVLERVRKATVAPVRPYREPLLDVHRQLDDYFAGRRRVFDLTLDLRLVSSFARRVLEETARIPFGEVRTYAQVAEAIGSPRSARAVGGALHRNPIAIVIPCHRVIGSSGDLTGYGGGLERKSALLSLEGVRWRSGSTPRVSTS